MFVFFIAFSIFDIPPNSRIFPLVSSRAILFPEKELRSAGKHIFPKVFENNKFDHLLGRNNSVVFAYHVFVMIKIEFPPFKF